MQRAIATVLFLAACGGPSSGDRERSATAPPAPSAVPAAAAPGPKPAPKPEAPEGDIVTAELKKMNSADFGKPPAEFRKGSVEPIAAPRAKTTSDGFAIQFPSHATITTPT